MEFKKLIIGILGTLNNLKNEIESIEDAQLINHLVEVNSLTNISKITASFNELLQIESFSNEQSEMLIQNLIQNNYYRLENIKTNYYENSISKYMDLSNLINETMSELKRFQYLSIVEDKNVILVGGNGVGKSSFASFLKDSLSNNIVVIPAQKFLYYDISISSLHLTDTRQVNNIQQSNFIGRGKFHNVSDQYEVQRYVREMSEVFSKLITAISNKQVAEMSEAFRNKDETRSISDIQKETTLFEINNLWSMLIPDIKLELDATNRTLKAVKGREEYSVNSLSDGEKVILYYICHVVLAEDNSFIIVDEPETFLNTSNYNRLWDTLEAYKKNCKFIYISHVIDFISTRSNVDLLWCKSFEYPNKWEIERLNEKSELTGKFPKELLSEILGARKPILFCEGKKSSLDYFVYSILFREEVIVYPVEGHNKVIEYTRAYNNSPIMDNNKAYGIVDRDLMSEEQILALEEDNVFSLPFNEIEMIFFTPEIMEKIVILDTEKQIEIFKNEFYIEVSSEINKIVTQKMKKFIDNNLSRYRVNLEKNSVVTSEDMVEEVRIWLDGLELETMEKRISEEFETVINSKSYDDLLKISPQKESVSKGLANKYLDSKYIEKAKVKLKQERKLAELIRNKYFSNVNFN
jgi:ABC-type cobalamin/Fe3+-siderophores transport system ATPase subunit